MRKSLFIALAAVVALIAGLGVALAQPPISQLFRGEVKKADGGAAPDGAVVYAEVGDYKTLEYKVKEGKYGYGEEGRLAVSPPDANYINRTIVFYVDEDGAGPLPPVKASMPRSMAFTPEGEITNDWTLTYTPAPPPTPTQEASPTPVTRATPTPPTQPTPTPTLPPTGEASLLYIAIGIGGLGAASLLLGAWAWRRGRIRA